MATYDNLPVYKSSYDLLLLTVNIIPHFRKSYKYTLGSKLQETLIELMSFIFQANCNQSKSEHLQKARENVEIVRLLFRLSNDLKLIDLKKFVEVNVLIESISKQLVGWERSFSKKI
jgi:hypothetical protein